MIRPGSKSYLLKLKTDFERKSEDIMSLAEELESIAGWVKFETSKTCDSLCSRGETERDADEAVHVVDAGEGRLVLRLLG